MAQSPAAFFCAADPTADGHRGATGFRGFGDFSVDLLLHTGYGGGGENLLPTYVLCHVSRCIVSRDAGPVCWSSGVSAPQSAHSSVPAPLWEARGGSLGP